MGEDCTISAEDLEALVIASLTANGVPLDDATDVAAVLVLADLFGIHTHGAQRIPEYVRRVGLGGITAQAEVLTTRVAPGVSVIDGGNGLGPLVGMHALRAAIAGARDCGVGAALARGSNHFGPVMPYSFRATQEGFASIIGSNATVTMAPTGGQEARLGNNPLGLGCPQPDGDPIILDMAMSMAARAKIRAALAAGTEIPDSWATDSRGRRTTDPEAALQGLLLPAGGHKGYGMAAMVDLFAGVLSGAAYLTGVSSWNERPEQGQDLGHFFLLLDVARLGDSVWLGARVRDFAQILRDSPPVDVTNPVRTPGELEMGTYHRQRRDGITVNEATVRSLEALCR